MMDLPLNLEAEQAVLGAVLLDGECITVASQYVRPEFFAKPAHCSIFEAMVELSELGEPVDLVTLTDRLQRKQLLVEVGGMSYLSALARSVPTSANIENYLRIVKENHLHRKALRAFQEKLANGGDDAESFISDIQATASELVDEMHSDRDFKHVSEVLQDHEEVVEQRQQQKGLTGVKTASKALDKLTNGRQKQDLIIIAARPSIGKTAYMLNDAKSAAESGTVDAVGIISIEMRDVTLSERLICMEARLDASKLKSGMLDSDEWMRYGMARSKLAELPIYIDDSPGITIQQIDAKVAAFKRKFGPRVIIYIDYLQLISGGKKFPSREAEMSFISRSLKRIARKNDCPIAAISSLSRACEMRQDKRPMLSDLRESGQIEFDADQVELLYRDDYYNPDTDKKNIIEIIVAKGRNTGTGIVEMAYFKNISRFFDIDGGRSA